LPTHYAVFDRDGVEAMLGIDCLLPVHLTAQLGWWLTGWGTRRCRQMTLRIMHFDHVIVAFEGEPINPYAK